MYADRYQPPRGPRTNPELLTEQIRRLGPLVHQVLRRLNEDTVITTIRTDDRGRTLSKVVQRKKAQPRPAEINAWLRVFRQLAELGLLPATDDPTAYDIEGTVATAEGSASQSESLNHFRRVNQP